MTIFDVNALLDATITDASVKRPPLPAGRDFVGIIGDLKPPRETQGKKDTTKSYVFLDIPIDFDLSAYPDVVEMLGGVTKVTINDSMSLDLTPSGALDMAPGKNGRLFRYREALAMNEAGKPFSFRQMTGRPIRCKIKNEPYNGEVYDKIDSVAKP